MTSSSAFLQVESSRSSKSLSLSVLESCSAPSGAPLSLRSTLFITERPCAVGPGLESRWPKTLRLERLRDAKYVLLQISFRSEQSTNSDGAARFKVKEEGCFSFLDLGSV